MYEKNQGNVPGNRETRAVAPQNCFFVSPFRSIRVLFSVMSIPFTTHEGSGLASTVRDVKKAWPKATVKDGFAIYGHEVRTGRAQVEKWLKGLGW